MLHPRRRTSVPAPLQVESTLTDRYQTTVPETVRRALRLSKRDKIRYTIRPDGEVVLTRAAAGENDDPALTPFLGFLARDFAEHPKRLRAVDAGLAQRIQALVGGVEVDLDATLSADDE
jgi:antitoxin PrlF